jgi:Sec-independent protein translocase protein TatA
MANLINRGKSFYTDEYIMRKWFIPKNEVFQFVSIYPRMRGMKILFRIFINLLFIFYYQKLKRLIQSKKKLIRKIKRDMKKNRVSRSSLEEESKEQDPLDNDGDKTVRKKIGI